ncbi:acetyl-CoA synthetase-like protein [Lentinula aff. detonsa]|uniref:Acetyl-CoA synthetase-like protein n=1 Tax=Lentinula aff. detonsa TaxID=2804958 RepID=A0AA38NCA1_9AGAR|nr:acetyl-CoA synthetase-like protein [Lentinula aff. detonsa]
MLLVSSASLPKLNRLLHWELRRASTLSIVQGPSYPPLSSRTLSEYFTQEILQRHSTRPALICSSERPRAHGGPSSKNLGKTSHLAWDFDEFERHIDAASRGLLSMGVQKGDRIGIIMGNNSAYAILQWAAARIGAILATINPSYRTDELIGTLRLVGIKHLVIVPSLRTSQYLKILLERFPSLASSNPGEIQEAELPELRNLIVVNNRDEHELIKAAVDWREIILWREDTREAKLVRDIAQGLDKDEVINLQFTSGTTGAPKAVSLTHHNLLNNGISIGRSMNISEKDVLCNVPPLFHCFGLVLGNLAFWSHSACVVYPSESFEPATIVDALIKEKCTALHGVPTHFLGILSEVEKRKSEGDELNFSNLRTGIAAGTTIPIDLMRRLISEMNLRDLTNAYGMTETSPVSFQTTPSDPIIKRVETVGKVLPHVKAKITDPKGNIVPVGVPGEVCVSGYLVQKGYWNDEEHTRQVTHKDPGDDHTVWMHTGDEGILDKEGYLRIVGRMKDIIIRGGENLFPVQIENVLLADHSIREAAVVSVPHKEYGEVVGAWIVRNTGTVFGHTRSSRNDIKNIVREKMNPQTAPAWVWFVGEDGVPAELPKTASGKVMKHVLRKWSKELAERGIGKVIT